MIPEPKRYEALDLIALRRSLGFTQQALAIALRLHKTTVERWEKYGTTARNHVEALLQLCEARRDMPAPPLRRRGNAPQPYKLSRTRNPQKTLIRLYKPDHKHHLRALAAIPEASWEVTQWLERDSPASAYWRRCSIARDGTITNRGAYRLDAPLMSDKG